MSLRWAVQASVLFLAASATAQSCFFPDGSASKHTPCSTAGHSSCCSADSFCLDNGLCYGGGIVSRGSCTDKTWGSDACAGSCRTESPDASIAITPCTNDGDNSTFTCGISSTNCQDSSKTFPLSGGNSLVLRPSQIASLIQPALESSTTTPSHLAASSNPANATTMYTSSQMAGLGCGLGLPLTFLLTVALCMLHKEKQKHAGPKLMYKLPDNHDEFLARSQPPPPRPLYSSHSGKFSVDSHAYSVRPTLGRENSVLTVDSGRTVAQPHSFLDRWDSTKGRGQAPAVVVHEMDGTSPHDPAVRFELSDKRFSKPGGA